MTKALSIRAFVISASLAAAAIDARASTVQYSGRVFGQTSSTALVVVGTFAPGVNPFNYAYDFGDAAGNIYLDSYQRAIDAGAFVPAGAGTFTSRTGIFSASGETNAISGTRLFIFAFDGPTSREGFQVLATSSLSNWAVNSSSTSIVAAEANVFVLGGSAPGGIALRGVPIPEPSFANVALTAAIAFLRRDR